MPETSTLLAGFAPTETPWTFAAAVKDPVVEEPLDLLWHRQVAFQVMRPLQWGGYWITPTLVTLVSGAVGVLAGAAYYRGATEGPAWFVAGSILLFVSVVLDCADGMLARLRGGGSHFGMLLDGLMDLVVGLAVWFGLAHSALAGMKQWWAWPLAFFVLVSIVAHCALYDSIKNSFLRHSLPRAVRPPAEPPVPTTPFARAVHVFYRTGYGTISAAFGAVDDAALDAAEPAQFRGEFMGTMRLVGWLGLGTHMFIVYCAGLLGALSLPAPFIALLILVGLGLNALTVSVIVSRRRAARRLLERLEA
jgi:phosphatidylglycerophosphate synthase